MSTTYDNLHKAYFPAEYAEILMNVLSIARFNLLSVKDALYHFRELSDDQAAEVIEHMAECFETDKTEGA